MSETENGQHQTTHRRVLGMSPSSKSRYRAFIDKFKKRRLDAEGEALATSEAEAERKKKQQRSRSFFTLLAALWGFLRGRHRHVVIALGTVTLSTIFGLVQPYATKIAIDNLMLSEPGPAGLPSWVTDTFGAHRVHLLVLLGVLLLVLALIASVIALWGRWLMTRSSKWVQVTIRRKAFEHAAKLPLHRVYQLKTGGATSVLREDAGGAGEMLFSLMYNPWKAIVQLIGAMVVLAWTDWRFLLAGLLVLPVVWVTHRTWIARIRPVFRAARKTRETTDAHAVEAFGGMRIVRGFARQKGEAARFSANNHLMARQEMLAWWWSRIAEHLWVLMIPAASVFILVYGGSRVVRGELSVGEVMMFTTYLLWLLGPLEILVGTATTVQNNLAGLDRVLDLLDEPTELTEGAERFAGAPRHFVSRGTTAGRITIENVSFKYPTRDEYVLRHVDLDVPAGTTVALVGPSGSGKTTLCNIVARFFDPSEGAVLLDGVDLRTIDPQSYRRLLGIVEQDVFLFDGPVIDNIAYARRGVGFDEVVRAAQAANADGFIRQLEHGYDTLIGERGVRLSGGQKQRIAIARALLADPKVLILDEATSNLDSESEALIQASLRRLMKDRTCFVIAHRLSTIRHADLIAVLEAGEGGGRIVERGTHDQLIAREGKYWKMLRMQLLEGTGQVISAE